MLEPELARLLGELEARLQSSADSLSSLSQNPGNDSDQPTAQDYDQPLEISGEFGIPFYPENALSDTSFTMNSLTMNFASYVPSGASRWGVRSNGQAETHHIHPCMLPQP